MCSNSWYMYFDWWVIHSLFFIPMQYCQVSFSCIWILISITRCHCNDHNMLWHTVLLQLRQNINEILKSQKTPHSSPSQVSYGVSIERILKKNDHIVMALHCITSLALEKLYDCVSEMVVLSYSVIYYIYIPGTLGPCFHYWCSVYGICKWSDTLWPVGRVHLFADYTISLSSLCRLIWKHWTTKMLVRYMMPSVCLRLRQFSQLSLYSLYGAVCLQLTQFSCDDRENVYFILLSSSNRKYESLTIV